jgi:hypothetical protein
VFILRLCKPACEAEWGNVLYFLPVHLFLLYLELIVVSFFICFMYT